MLWLDLDRFKEVNDTLGHAVGDGLLNQVADRLRSCIRGEDTVARLGGDEFAIIQNDVDQPLGATGLAQRVIEEIGAPYHVDGHQLLIGASAASRFTPMMQRRPTSFLRTRTWLCIEPRARAAAPTAS